MYRGKYFAVGGNPDNFPASPKTRWALHRASGGEYHYRETKGLTQGEAFDLLTKYDTGQLKSRKTFAEMADSALGAAYFEALMDRAIATANAAGRKWLKKNRKSSFVIYLPEQDREVPVCGSLGDAYIRRDGHSAFTDWLRKNMPDIIDGKRIVVPHEHMEHLEFDLLRTCEEAALRVFRMAGVPGLDLVEQPC